jgi:putative flippase GtrA
MVSRQPRKEVRTLFRASLSSGVATALDGLFYQALLLVIDSYALAAFTGAVVGGITNFGINRHWAFASTSKRLGFQAIEYVFMSLLTYIALQTCLFLLVEGMHIGPHSAWIPAKALSWLLVSYPLQRFIVFSEPRTSRGEREPKFVEKAG